MSSLWTPDGERRVPRTRPAASPVGDDHDDHEHGDAHGDGPPDLASVQQELAGAPAELVIGNHCVGLFQLAALHLAQQPPNLVDAKLSVDALGALVEGLKGRLGPDEATLVDALAQIRLFYVQIAGVQAGGGSASATNR